MTFRNESSDLVAEIVRVGREAILENIGEEGDFIEDIFKKIKVSGLDYRTFCIMVESLAFRCKIKVQEEWITKEVTGG